jgi:type I restriction enzyme, S subunit
MQTYQTMKSSGVVWLGDIPTIWGIKRAKYILSKVQEKPREDDEVVTAFRDGEVVLRKLRREDGFTFADKEIGYQHVSRGDLVVHAMDAFAGAIGVSKSNGKMSPVCSICRPVDDGIDTEYYSYLLRSMTKTNYLVAIAKGIRERSTDFRYRDLGKMSLPLPTFAEQQRIVRYINEETAKIDTLIAKQERLLELLEEKRIATINRAVTMGLDKNTEMAEVNVPWVSEISKNWQIMRVKDLFSANDEALSNNIDMNYEFDYVDISSVDKYEGILKREHMTFESSPSRARRIVRKGDIIIGAVRTYLEAIAQISDADGLIVSTGFVVLRPREAADSDYYFYALRSGPFMANVVANSVGVSYPAINADALMSLHIPVPPKEERHEIANYCRQETKKMDNLKQLIHKELTLLKERRVSLISNVVTGKVKV